MYKKYYLYFWRFLKECICVPVQKPSCLFNCNTVSFYVSWNPTLKTFSRILLIFIVIIFWRYCSPINLCRDLVVGLLVISCIIINILISLVYGIICMSFFIIWILFIRISTRLYLNWLMIIMYTVYTHNFQTSNFLLI